MTVYFYYHTCVFKYSKHGTNMAICAATASSYSLKGDVYQSCTCVSDPMNQQQDVLLHLSHRPGAVQRGPGALRNTHTDTQILLL